MTVMPLIGKAKPHTKQKSKPGRAVAEREKLVLGGVPFLELHSIIKENLLSVCKELGIGLDRGLQRGISQTLCIPSGVYGHGEAGRNKRK